MTSELDTTMAKMNKGFLEWAEKTNRESYIQADEYVKDLRAIYDDAIERLDGKILGHLNKIETEEGLSLADAKKWMSIEDSKKATDSLKNFIRQSEMFKIDPSLEQELRMMSRRVRISYLQGMELELKKSVASLMDTEQKKLFAHLSKSYENKYYKDLYGLSRIAGEKPITKVDPRALDRLIRRPWCLDGKTIGDRLSQRQVQNINNLRTILGRSLATGLNQKETIKEVSKTLGRSLRSASVLVHTETASIIEQASMDAYKEYGIDQYQITATLDLRTSEICQEMDGKVFNTKDKVQGINFPPFHPNCRTTTVPYFDDEIQREMDKEVGRMARHPVSGRSKKVYGVKDYKDWEKKYIKHDKRFNKGYNSNKGIGAKQGKIDIEIDKFTNCLIDNRTNKEVDTYVKPIQKHIRNIKAWNFNWNKTIDEGYDVFSLKVVGSDDVQGLVATKLDPSGGVYINLVESARHNRGKDRDYTGVGAHLFAIACKEAKDKGQDFVFFDAKTNLIDYYRKKLGAVQIGSSQRMFIDSEAFEKLISTYFKEGI